VSIERLLHDKLFASNCKGMTGLPDHTALVMFFNICLGFAGGVLPLQYRSDRSGSATFGSVSTASIEEHMNYMFLFYMCYDVGRIRSNLPECTSVSTRMLHRDGKTMFPLTNFIFIDHVNCSLIFL
jgi:hypothetical protein